MPHRHAAAVLGLPVVFETNSVEAVEAARVAYGHAPTDNGRRRPLRVQIVADANLKDDGGARPVVSLPRHDRLELSIGSGRATAETLRGEARALLSPATIAAAGFREAVLDHLTLFLVTGRDRCPLHAGGIARDGRALLLAGPSGLGKSSLTYAAMRRGFEVLADDAIYVQRDPTLRLWSLPRRIHLPMAATQYFPELADRATIIRPDGRRKVPVDITPDARARVPWQGPVGLCILSSPSASPVDRHVEALTSDAAVTEMRATLEGGFRRFESSLDACVRELGSGGCWRLAVNAEPMLLVDRLSDLMRAISGPGGRDA